MAQRGSKDPTFGKCGRNYSGGRRESFTCYFICGQTGHFIKSIERISGKMVEGEIEPSLHQLIHHRGLHLEDLLSEQAEEQTSFFLSTVTKSMRIQQMLSVVRFKSLPLLFYAC